MGGGGVTVRAALLLQSLSNMTCNYAVGGRKPFIVSELKPFCIEEWAKIPPQQREQLRLCSYCSQNYTTSHNI